MRLPIEHATIRTIRHSTDVRIASIALRTSTRSASDARPVVLNFESNFASKHRRRHHDHLTSYYTSLGKHLSAAQALGYTCGASSAAKRRLQRSCNISNANVGGAGPKRSGRIPHVAVRQATCWLVWRVQAIVDKDPSRTHHQSCFNAAILHFSRNPSEIRWISSISGILWFP